MDRSTEMELRELRQRIIEDALAWQKAFGVSPAITSSISELDAAILVGCSLDCLMEQGITRTSVTRGHDFVHDNALYQVKANRSSGKPGSKVTLVNKPKNYNWDYLVYILYDPGFRVIEAYKWEKEKYIENFDGRTRLGPKDMSMGDPLNLAPLINFLQTDQNE